MTTILFILLQSVYYNNIAISQQEFYTYESCLSAAQILKKQLDVQGVKKPTVVCITKYGTQEGK